MKKVKKQISCKELLLYLEAVRAKRLLALYTSPDFPEVRSRMTASQIDAQRQLNDLNRDIIRAKAAIQGASMPSEELQPIARKWKILEEQATAHQACRPTSIVGENHAASA